MAIDPPKVVRACPFFVPSPRTAPDVGRKPAAQLADEIVRGTLHPGNPLDETELARHFEVSRTPAREAIRLLAASGLVETYAHRAAVVAMRAHIATVSDQYWEHARAL